ncbi:transcriptional regulator BetI, partial [Pseudomonas sp. SIMBA_059]
GDAFDTDQAIRIAYEYMDLQLAKQQTLGTIDQASEQPRTAIAKQAGA